MNKKEGFAKFLAVIGTALVWIPLLAPLMFSLVSWTTDGVFRFDYLMPAELVPLVLIGGALLVLAAWRAQLHLGLQVWSLLAAITALISMQLLAVASGLASGETPIGGWQWALALALLGVYTVAVAVLAIGGILLLRDLFKGPQSYLGH